MVNVRTAGRESMVATPRAERSRRLTPSPSPEPSQFTLQPSLPVVNETLVMDDYDREDEEELDELDVLQSDDRPEEDELAPADGATGQPADVDEEIDELENEAATPDVTPRGPKLAMRSGQTTLSPSPSTAASDKSNDNAPLATPGQLSPSLTLPSVEAMLDQRAEDTAAAAAAASAATAKVIAAPNGGASSPPAPVNAVASSSRSPERIIPASQPRFDFWHSQTFFMAGRRPVKAEGAMEVDEIRRAVKDAGGSFVKLSDQPSYVIEVGELSATMDARIDSMESTELLSKSAFRKLFAKGVIRASNAARRAGKLKDPSAAPSDLPAAASGRGQSTQPASDPSGSASDAIDGSEHVPTIEEPEEEVMAESTEEHQGVDVSADTSANGSTEGGLIFVDRNGHVIKFEIQPELALGVQSTLRQLILEHGGEFAPKISDADVRLVDPTSTKGKSIRLRETDEVNWRCRPWHWVSTCVVRSRLVKLDKLDSPEPVFVRKTGGEHIRLCVVAELEDSIELEELIRANGGLLVEEERADIIVVDERSEDPAMMNRLQRVKTLSRPRLASPAWVRDSVAARKRCLLPRRPAAVAAPIASAPVSSSQDQAPLSTQPVPKSAAPASAVPRRGPGRPAGIVTHEFTNDDDKKMIRYMAAVMHLQKTKPPTSGQQIGATGNRIFQDMCAEDDAEVRPWATRHTWQSWRNRFMKKRSVGYEAALERRILKLEEGKVDCPELERLQTKHFGKRQSRSKAASRSKRPPSPQLETVDDCNGPSEVESGTPRPSARGSRAAGPSNSTLTQSPRTDTVVAEEVEEAQALADVLSPDPGRRSPTIPIDDLLEDDIYEGGMDHVPDMSREVSVPPLQPPSDGVQPEEEVSAEAAAKATNQTEPADATLLAKKGPVSGGPPDADDDDAEDDDASDGTGHATQVMHTTLAALAGGILEVDVHEIESEDDELEAAVPAGRTDSKTGRTPSGSDEAEQSDIESVADDGAGGATLAMQALMEHVAEPTISDESSDEDDLHAPVASIPQSAQATPAGRPRTRSPSPPPPARSSRKTTPTGELPVPVEAAHAQITQPQVDDAVQEPNGPAEQPTPLAREKRRLSRPLPRKSLDLPGIGHVPHFDLSGPASKKPRLSGRTETTASTTPAPRTISPKEQVIAWAIGMETKYAVDRRRCTPFLQAVYPEFGAAERILFASLPLEDGHVWSPDEDAALLDMQGPVLEQLERTLGEPACYRRLRLLKRHRRNISPLRL